MTSMLGDSHISPVTKSAPNNILHLAPCSAVNTKKIDVHGRQGGLSMEFMYCVSALSSTHLILCMNKKVIEI